MVDVEVSRHIPLNNSSRLSLARDDRATLHISDTASGRRGPSPIRVHMVAH